MDNDNYTHGNSSIMSIDRRSYLKTTGALATAPFWGSVPSEGLSAQLEGQSDELNPDRFENPPNSSRPTILWFWNGTMSEEVIAQQLADMRSIGVHDAVIYPRAVRSPLKPDFFSEGWFDRVGFAIEEAKENGMTLWLLNDDVFPSGRGAGFVLDGGKIGDRKFDPHPEFRKQQLLRHTERVSGPTTVDLRERFANFLPSQLQIDEGKLLVSSPSHRFIGDITLLNHGYDWTDYRFSFDTKPLEIERGGTTYAQAGWVVRAQDSGNGYVWLLGNYPHSGAESGSLTKFTIKDGTRMDRTVEPLPFDVVSDEWYHVETTIEGDEIITSIDGQQVDVTTDDTFEEGTIGFREGTIEEAYFDTLRVEDLSGNVLYEADFEGTNPTGFERPQNVVAVAALPVEDDKPQLEGAIDLTALYDERTQWEVPTGEFVVESYNEQFSHRIKPRNQLIDVLSGDAVAQYTDVIHEEYFRRFGDEFGTTIRGFWDDIEKGPLVVSGGVPWSPSLADEIDSQGYTLAEVLPAVFRDFADVGREERGTFWRTTLNQHANAYYRTQGQWAAEHGVNMISNAADNNDPAWIAGSFGDLLKNYQWFQTPGVDIISNQIDPTSENSNHISARYGSSSAHQMGRSWVMSESLGAFGWDVTPEVAQYVIGYMALRGANMTCLHAYWSNDDPELMAAPPPIQPMNTWWFAMDELVEWTSRVMELNHGSILMETALLQPQRAIEAYQGTPEQGGLDSGFEPGFERVAFALGDAQVDFDFLNEASVDGDSEMRRQASIRAGTLELGPQQYRVVVIPPTPMLSLQTVERLRKFARTGGVVVAVGRLPTEETDGRDRELEQTLIDLFDTDPTDPTEVTHSIGAGTAAFVSDVDAMQTVIREVDAPAVSLPPTDGVEDITVLRRTRNGDRVFLLMNEGSEPFENEVTFPISGVPEIWDPADGSTRTATQFRVVDDGTAMPLRLDPFELIAVVFPDDAPNPSQVPHILTTDLPVTAVEQIDAQTLSATVRAESAVTEHLTGRTGGRVYESRVDISGAFDAVEVSGPWRFRFERDGATWREADLSSWTDLDPDFSGSALYETTVTLSEGDLDDRRLDLDLGRVQDVAEVEVNGEQVATLTVRPYHVDVTDALEPGENRIRVRVTNTNANERGDSLPSGLFGPVRLDPFRLVQTELTHEPGGQAIDLSVEGADLSVFPRQEATVTVSVTNRLRRPVTDTLTATVEDPLQVSPQTTTLRLDGWETATVDSTITVPRSVTGSDFELTVKFGDETETATVTVPAVVDTNLARFGTANVSSSHSSSRYPASQAIDGNNDSSDWGQTGWNDDTRSEFPDWLEVSFPVPFEVDRVDVFTLDSADNPASEYGLRDYDVQVTVDGEYQTVAEVRDNTFGHVSSVFDSVTTESVRLLIYDTNDGNYSRVVEFEIYNES